MTLGECFAFYGVIQRNRRWSWSARSADGQTVVMTLWKDRLAYLEGKPTYDDRDLDSISWRDTPGHRERLENVIWARDRCDGFFKTIITVAKDDAERPRRIASCFVQANFRMKLTDLDEQNGGFRAVHVA